MTNTQDLLDRTEEVIILEGNNTVLANLCGPLDENLRQIGATFGVLISHRGNRFSIKGKQVHPAITALRYFHEHAHADISLEALQLGLVELKTQQTTQQTAQQRGSRPTIHGKQGLSASLAEPTLEIENELLTLKTRRSDLRARTPRQQDYLRQILSHDITFGIGPAGTGKTYLAVACAVDALEREAVKRLILTRPAVEAGEHLGFLPGDLSQKVDPYLRPLYDALYDLLGFDRVQKLFEKQIIEIAPLAYMRGRTLNQAFIILDEAQNTTPEQMKMFLTRIGFGSKAVVTGDPSQMDLPRGHKCGLTEALAVLSQVNGIARQEFTSVDVVRHPLVARIVEAYEKATLTADKQSNA